jgi:NDP-sugar pyrophosphorylase family protein
MTEARELMPAVILAGGLATRLRPLTETVPKALVDVNGKPFLQHQLELLRGHGVRSVILLVGHLGELIRERFGDGSTMGMSLRYSFDGPELLGTAGAIRHALSLLPEIFFVMYGDSYLPCDYRVVEEVFKTSRADGLMTVYRNEGKFDASNVEFDGKRIVRYDKADRSPTMRYIDYGLGAFRRGVFDALPAGEKQDLATVYQSLLRAGRLAAYEVQERFYEIGSPEGIRDTSAYLADHDRNG